VHEGPREQRQWWTRAHICMSKQMVRKIITKMHS
jgi:hypothetical protein